MCVYLKIAQREIVNQSFKLVAVYILTLPNQLCVLWSFSGLAKKNFRIILRSYEKMK